MLPSDEFLLTTADICHNFLPYTAYGTTAVGAVGLTPFKIRLVLGVNSSAYHEVKLTSERLIPPSIRNSSLVRKLKIEPLQDSYHAETSIMLYAKEKKLKIFGLASSRTICDVCINTMERYPYLFDKDCTPVDAWKFDGRRLTQRERGQINRYSGYFTQRAVAIKS